MANKVIALLVLSTIIMSIYATDQVSMTAKTSSKLESQEYTFKAKQVNAFTFQNVTLGNTPYHPRYGQAMFYSGNNATISNQCENTTFPPSNDTWFLKWSGILVEFELDLPEDKMFNVSGLQICFRKLQNYNSGDSKKLWVTDFYSQQDTNRYFIEDKLLQPEVTHKQLYNQNGFIANFKYYNYDGNNRTLCIDQGEDQYGTGFAKFIDNRTSQNLNLAILYYDDSNEDYNKQCDTDKIEVIQTSVGESQDPYMKIQLTDIPKEPVKPTQKVEKSSSTNYFLVGLVAAVVGALAGAITYCVISKQQKASDGHDYQSGVNLNNM